MSQPLELILLLQESTRRVPEHSQPASTSHLEGRVVSRPCRCWKPPMKAPRFSSIIFVSSYSKMQKHHLKTCRTLSSNTKPPNFKQPLPTRNRTPCTHTRRHWGEFNEEQVSRGSLSHQAGGASCNAPHPAQKPARWEGQPRYKKLIHPGEHRIQLAGSGAECYTGKKRSARLCQTLPFPLLGAKAGASPRGEGSVQRHTDTRTRTSWVTLPEILCCSWEKSMPSPMELMIFSI